MPVPGPFQGGPIAPVTGPIVPIVAQQPMPMPMPVPQPVLVPQPHPNAMPYGIPAAGYPGMMMGGPQAGGPGNYGIHPEPALGVGRTPNENLQHQLDFAYNHGLNDPQDFKPADDDKMRWYWVRELDGHWTQRNRLTIDAIGCRWYLTEYGAFYAVKLPD